MKAHVGRDSLRVFLAAAVCSTVVAVCLAGCSGAPGAPAGSAGSPASPSASAAASGGAAGDADAADLETHGSLGMFEATALDGGSYTQVDLAGTDVTVFNFWSTTCGPCVSEMDDLASLARRLPDRVQIVNVCLDGQYNAARAQEILDAAGFDGTTLVGGTNGFLDLCRSVQYTPTRVLVTGDGVVVGDALVGALGDFDAEMLGAVNAVLAWSGEEGVSLETA